MKKLNLSRALTLSVASAMALAACAPQVAPTASTANAPANQAVAPAAAKAPVAVRQTTLQAGTVKGQVMALNEATGKFEAVSGATVKVAGVTATTDASGAYTVSGLAAGAHDVTVAAQGMKGAKATVQVNAVWGLSNVNLAMVKPALGLKTMTDAPRDRHWVVGVVRDVRGCAVTNAVIDATTSSGNFNGSTGDDTWRTNDGGRNEAARFTTDTGFYAFEVRGVNDTAAKVMMNAYGATAGNLKLERSGSAVTVTLTPMDETYNEDTDTWEGGNYDGDLGGYVSMADIQLNQFKQTSAPVLLDTAGLMLGHEYTMKVAAGCSGRADEFFIRLTSGGQTYDVVPTTIERFLPETDRGPFWLKADMEDAPWDGSRYVTFRVPGMLAGATFTAQVMQLGLVPSTASAVASAVPFSAADWATSLVLSTPSVKQPEAATRLGINKNVVQQGGKVVYSVALKNVSKATLEFNYETFYSHAQYGDGLSLDTATFGGVEVPSFGVAGCGAYENEGFQFVRGLKLAPGETKTLVLTFDSSNEDRSADINFYSNQAFIAGSEVGLNDQHNYNFDGGKLPIGWEIDAERLDPIEFPGSSLFTLPMKNFEVDGWTATKSVSSTVSGAKTVTLVLNPPSTLVGPIGALRIVDETENTGVGALTATLTGATVKAGANTTLWKIRAISEDTTVNNVTLTAGATNGGQDEGGNTEMAFEIYPSTPGYPTGVTAKTPLTITYKVSGAGLADLTTFTNATPFYTEIRALSLPSGATGTTFDSFWDLDSLFGSYITFGTEPEIVVDPPASDEEGTPAI